MKDEELIYSALATAALAILTYMMYRAATKKSWIEYSKKEKGQWQKNK